MFISDQFGILSYKVFDDISLTFQKHTLISTIKDALLFVAALFIRLEVKKKTKPRFILFNAFWKRPTDTGIHVISIFCMDVEKGCRTESPQVADTGYGLQIPKAAISRHQTVVVLKPGGSIGGEQFLTANHNYIREESC